VGKPAKLTGKTGSWTFDFGSAQRVDYVVLGPHNLDAGLSVKFQGNGVGVVEFAHGGHHHRDSGGGRRQPAGDRVERPDRRDRLRHGGFRYWRLEVAGRTRPTSRWARSGWARSSACWRPDMGRTYRWGYALDEKRRVVEQQTEYGIITTYDCRRGCGRWRSSCG